MTLTESEVVESSAIKWFKEIGYSYIHGSELTPENNERDSYRDVILKARFFSAVRKINPWLTETLTQEVYRKITELDHPDFTVKGKLFYDSLINGVKLTFLEGKEEKTQLVKLFDFEAPEKNEFLISNQFTVEYEYEKERYRRPDLVLFINGIPVSVFEFKNFNAFETAREAFLDHKAKQRDIPQLYVYAQIVVASDGLETKYGSPMSDWERFFIWEGIEDDNDLEVREIGENLYTYFYRERNQELTSLELLIKGLFDKRRLLEYIRDFVFYEKTGDAFTKKIAMYHQFYAVRKAIVRTIKCVTKGKTPEERRVGVVWHTQGSGKSLTMLFYARKALKDRELENPLIVFITDRNELDEQLYKVFAEMPIAKQAESIKDLQETITKTTGGIVFTTIQKFGTKTGNEYPHLTDRKNIIIIADEAHRSQYRELAQNLRKAIPNASFMGFTATPIELEDRDTYLVFGEPISIYTMDKGIRHKVIVPIYYEARLAELHLTNEFIDEEFEEISERVTTDPEIKEHLKRKYAKLEEIILSEQRLEKVARDIAEHFKRRREDFEGKALIVVISRKVAVKLYEKIKKIDPELSVVVVMSGNKTTDPEEFHPHLRDKGELEEIANNFKNPDTPPQVAIVVDMWLTGFDVPCLNTMYFDKPMRGHTLMQAIARVNRVFKDKPGGLLVDYIGIADNLKKSLGIYAVESTKTLLSNIDEVINLLKEKHDIVCSMLSDIDFRQWEKASADELSKLTVLVYEKLSRDEENKKKFIKHFIELKKLYALASPHPETIKISNDLRFFEMLKKMLVKYTMRDAREISRNLEYEMNQLISRSISAQEPVDILSLMGKEKLDISVLDEQFLSRFKDMEFKNYALDVLTKIVKDEIKVRFKKNPFRYRSLYESLNKLIEGYNKRLLTVTEIIEQLIIIARDVKRQYEEGKSLNLTEEELAFYDYLLSERGIFNPEIDLREIAKEIINIVGPYVKISDWHKKEMLKAKIRSSLKMLLPKYIKPEALTEYEILDRISGEIVEHAESLFAMAA